MNTIAKKRFGYTLIGLAVLSLGATYSANKLLEIGPVATITGPAPEIISNDSDADGFDWEVEFSIGSSSSLEIAESGSVNGTGPFKIFEDATEDALSIREDGITVNGERTDAPIPTELDIFNDNSTGSCGLSLYSGTVGSSPLARFLVNGTGSTPNFSIVGDSVGARPIVRGALDAPTDSLSILSSGQVRLGGNFFDPVNSAAMHIIRDDGSCRLDIEEQNATTAFRTLSRMINNGPSKLEMTNTDTGRTWALVADFNNQFQIRQTGPNTANFAIREDGTFSFNNLGQPVMAINPTGDVFIGGVLTEGSDRNVKENIKAVDSSDVLSTVVDLQLSTWNYIADKNDTKHLGPMAQDFHAAFGLGNDDKKIATLDTSGVALAAIQGLNKKLETEVQTLNKLNEKKDKEIERLSERLERLEQMVESLSSQ